MHGGEGLGGGREHVESHGFHFPSSRRMGHFLVQVSIQKTGRSASGQARLHQSDSGGCSRNA